MLSSIARSFARSTPRASARAFSSLRLQPCQGGSLLDVGRRPIFNEEHDVFREQIRSWYNTKVVPFHDAWEAEGQVPRQLWEDAGEAGLLGCNAPEEFGGMDDIKLTYIVWEEQGYSLCTGPGWALHSDIVIPYLCKYYHNPGKYVPDLVSGKKIAAIAMTEPGTGSDLAGVTTTAVKDGDHYVINGSKTFITNGAMADVIVVVAKTDPSKGAHGISLFVVEADMEGFSRGRRLKKMGMAAQDTSELFFEDVRVPAENMVGEEGKGFAYLMTELAQERLIVGAMGVCSAEAIFEKTRQYTKERKAFGKSLFDGSQVIRHTLVDAKMQLAVARSFMDNCLELHAQGKLDPATASMAKVHGSETQVKVIQDLSKLWGGSGYMAEMEVCRAHVDSMVQPIYAGANDVLRELVSRTI